jgi:hypothetical protein
MIKKIAVFALLTLLLLPMMHLINCSTEIEVEQRAIATVGDRVIDWKLVKRSFHLNPKWGKGLTNREAYQNQLDYLIDQKLLAQEAVSRGIYKDEFLMARLKFIKEKEMIKELYRREVSSNIEITDQEYRQAYKRSKIRVQFEFVSTPDFDNAVGYLKELESSKVNEIYLMAPAIEEKGTSPMFGFGDLATEIEEVIFEMKPGELKGPIKVGNEYMVFKLIDGLKEKFMSESDFAENKSRIRKVLFERRSRKISDGYIYNILKNDEIFINPETFFPLSEHFSQYVSNKNSENPFPLYLDNKEIKTAQGNLEEISDQVLAKYKGGEFTVGEFLLKLLSMPRGIRPQVNMAPQLKKAIAISIRNDYLAQQAYKQGLDKTANVKYETEIQSDEILSRWLLKEMKKKLQVSEAEMNDFKAKENFAKVNEQFNGKLTDSMIQDIILDYKFALCRKNFSDSLLSVYPVKVDSIRLSENVRDPEKMIKHKPINFAYVERFN